MDTGSQIILGALFYFIIRYCLGGFYTIGPNERAVKTSFGKAQRLGDATTLDSPLGATLREEERERYNFPQLRVIGPGWGFKWPWEKIHKTSIAIETVSMAYDPETPSANAKGTVLEAVTKDHLNIGLTGQLRFRISEQNLYAYLFGVKQPMVHVMGYFVSVLRQLIANFESPTRGALETGSHPAEGAAQAGPQTTLAQGGISINDLRKNLRDINDRMFEECKCAAARYGMVLDASLITGIEPPQEVDAALAAINTAHNHVSSDISLAQAAADQRIVESRRAVEIETLKAQAEVQPLLALADQLQDLKAHGALKAYLRNVRLSLIDTAERIVRQQS